MSLSLVYRAARPSLLAPSTSRVSLTAVSKRHAGLSAIISGLVRSEKARPQGARPGRFNDLADGAKRMTYAERQKAREQLAKERPDFKIRKGKKDITDYPDQARPKSRQARFYDPDSAFGKKSLVYQMKTGKLREDVKALRGDGDRSADSAFERTGPRPDLRPPPRRAVRKMARTRDSRRGRDTGDVVDFVAELSGRAGSSRDPPRRDTPRRDGGGFGDRGAPRRGRDAFGDRDSPRRDRDAPARDGPRRDNTFRPKNDRDPISIPYTTAASQFLYGKAVVEAALRSSRRKLYKLYIYGGANRQNAADDALIQKLAQRKNIPVTIVGEDGLRLLDKLSSSRPHNGFVLEASPLPQPPLTALGPLPEDYPTNPRYPVILGHQSAEDAAVNGTPESIPSPSASHKPLVVILDQILDPGNLGAILRTVSFLGATAVGITRKGSATLTPVALKASAGASETLTLFSIASLPEFLNSSRENGWAVYAAVADGPSGTKQRRHMDLRDVEETDPLKREPCVLLVGNEGEGLGRLVVKKADYEVNIPNLSAAGTGVDSLNVSVAVGLLCSAFLRGVTKEMGGLGMGVGEGEAGEGVKEVLW
ncbi:hypothetical protein C8A01DRAFT_21049 [Parachaetomium inaequale]|uniref:rRNA methyltransferase 1, mitochondrial n=1 Tax=Parachaetomium inaequale TaxID=2588326 RepID=A0AAN6P7G8_9PEZI|nr:hypothetical protein C8A01DRAFT_21049 [Parachaetomium inaequale]